MLHRLLHATAQALERRPALAILTLASLAAVHLWTITISPTVWQDEVQTVDYGRNFMAPDPTWSISWSPSQRPVTPLSYLGPVLQDAAYRSLAPSILGPRLSALLGALVAAILTFLWLRSRLVSALPALALSTAFLLDPLFVQGYRGARVDGWVFALVMAACVLVRRSPGTATSAQGVSVRLAAACALLVIAVFVWPSAVFLFPLVAAEAVLVLAPLNPSWRTVLGWGFAGAAGGVLALALCVLPIIDLIPVVIADTFVVVDTNSASGGWPALPRAIVQFVLAYQHSPLLPLAAAVAAWYRGNRILAAAAVVAALAMLPTHVYVHRVVYLLPYLIGLIGEGWRQAGPSRPRAWPSLAVAAAVIWAVGLSLVARPALALTARDARDPARLLEAAAQMPALRSQRVYLGQWEFYYAGRQFGWKMVRAYGGGSDAYREMLASLDFALVGEGEPAESRAYFAAPAWHLIQRIELPSTAATVLRRQPGQPRRYELYSRLPQTAPIR